MKNKNLCMILLILSLNLAMVSSDSFLDCSGNLVSYYNFDSGMTADICNRNPATVIGNVNSAPSIYGNGIMLHGFSSSEDAISLGKSFAGDNNISVSLWFKRSKVNERQHLFRSSNNAIFFHINNNVLQFAVYEQNMTFHILSSNTYIDDKWHNAIASYGFDKNANTSSLTIYLDGKLDSSVSYSGKRRSDIGALYIGIPDWYTFNGLIDEFRVFDKSLSPSEAMKIYTLDLSQTPDTNPPETNATDIPYSDDNVPDTGAPQAFESRIRLSHPRLFYTESEISNLRSEIKTEPKKSNFLAMKKMVDGYPLNVNTSSGKMSYGFDSYGMLYKTPKPVDWDEEAAVTAMIYLLTGNETYYIKAINMINTSLIAYREDFDKGMSIEWWSRGRINWLAAYDLLYNNMSIENRKYFLREFYDIFEDYQSASKSGKGFYQFNNRGIEYEGFYGELSLYWYMGLAGYKDAINDNSSAAYLRKGYSDNEYIMKFREKDSQDDGCYVTYSQNYAFGAYPYSSIYYLYSWKSATGEDLAKTYKHLGLMPTCVLWNSFTPGFRSTSLGDEYHKTNYVGYSNFYNHFKLISDLYKTSNYNYSLDANYILKLSENVSKSYLNVFYFLSFKVGDTSKYNENSITAYSRYFPGTGVISMRSGNAYNDTYAVFVTSATTGSVVHRNYDINHFVIYKNGYLALDSGTRGEDNTNSCIWELYHTRTVAHNTMMIYSPNEVNIKNGFNSNPLNWSCNKYHPAAYNNCGGQNTIFGSKILGYETNDDYTYILGDATPAYQSDKVDEVLREFVFIYPNYFVIYDRVKSDKAEYKKEWLLHTQNKPELQPDGSYLVSEGTGKMMMKTLYPISPKTELIGGPGNEFYVCGKNVETDSISYTAYKYLGNWRIAVSPPVDQQQDYFMTVLEVGDMNDTIDMTKYQTIEDDSYRGVSFGTSDNKRFTVKFKKVGKGGDILVERYIGTKKALATSVQSQAGMNG